MRPRLTLALTTAALLVTVAATMGLPMLRWLDVAFFHERVRDGWGRLASNEEWSALAPLPAGLDWAWFDSAGQPVRIAHALGDPQQASNNTLEAYERSRARGFRLFEVDIALDDAGRERCFHGPGTPPPFEPRTGCTFARLLELAIRDHTWLVIDTKDAFEPMAEAVLARAIQMHAAHRVVFQLYSPSDVDWYRRRALPAGAAAPIVTAYRSRRSANHIGAQLPRLHLRVLTVPAGKLGALAEIDGSVALLTHPLHSCAQWIEARGLARVRGGYMDAGLDTGRCDTAAAN